MGHSSLTLYIPLYLSGYGLELSDLEALRTSGPGHRGHPEVNHTPGVETATGPLGLRMLSPPGPRQGQRGRPAGRHPARQPRGTVTGLLGMDRVLPASVKDAGTVTRAPAGPRRLPAPQSGLPGPPDLASPRPKRRVRDLWLFDSMCANTRGRTPKPLSGRDRGLCFTCLAASFLTGRAPRYGGDRGIGAVQRLGCSGRRITALGDQREAMHQRPG